MRGEMRGCAVDRVCEPGGSSGAGGAVDRRTECSRAATVADLDPAAIEAAMPRTAKALAGAVGYLRALEIMRRWGGKRIYVRRTLAGRVSPVDLFGPETAAQLVGAFGGRQLEVPLLASVERFCRDAAIKADMAAGDSNATLSRRYGLCIRYLRTIRAKHADGVAG